VNTKIIEELLVIVDLVKSLEDVQNNNVDDWEPYDCRYAAFGAAEESRYVSDKIYALIKSLKEVD